jgi:phosphate transport system permease protein
MEKIEADITKAGGYTGRRMSKDKLFKHVMTFGGLSVIIAISLIFVYLASVVVPLFMPATMEKLESFPAVGVQQETTVHLTAEEQAEIGVRFANQGSVAFFDMRTGKAMGEERVALPEGAP